MQLDVKPENRLKAIFLLGKSAHYLTGSENHEMLKMVCIGRPRPCIFTIHQAMEGIAAEAIQLELNFDTLWKEDPSKTQELQIHLMQTLGRFAAVSTPFQRKAESLLAYILHAELGKLVALEMSDPRIYKLRSILEILNNQVGDISLVFTNVYRVLPGTSQRRQQVDHGCNLSRSHQTLDQMQGSLRAKYGRCFLQVRSSEIT